MHGVITNNELKDILLELYMAHGDSQFTAVESVHKKLMHRIVDEGYVRHYKMLTFPDYVKIIGGILTPKAMELIQIDNKALKGNIPMLNSSSVPFLRSNV